MIETVDHLSPMVTMDLDTSSLMRIGRGVKREQKTAITIFEKARRALFCQACKRGLYEVAEFDVG
jgi:hypothetical protein